MSQSMQEAVRRAEAVVQRMGADYDQRLEKHLRDLQKALDALDRDQAVLVAHTLKGESGMFGWPLISEVAGWLRQLLETEADDALCRTDVIELHLHTLCLLFSENLRGEAPAGQKLIRQLYGVIEKQGLLPESAGPQP